MPASASVMPIDHATSGVAPRRRASSAAATRNGTWTSAVAPARIFRKRDMRWRLLDADIEERTRGVLRDAPLDHRSVVTDRTDRATRRPDRDHARGDADVPGHAE